MVKQTLLPFKLEISNEKLTSQAGLALVAECAEAIRLPAAFAEELPTAGSNRGYSPWQFARAVLLMLSGGGRALDDLRELRFDQGLIEALGLVVPSADATGDWLRRSGARGGESSLNRVNRRAIKAILRRSKRKKYTLDIDAAFIEAHKREAKYSYHNQPGYYPMTGWLAEEEICLGYEYREGNDSPKARNLEFIKFCEQQLPRGKSIGLVRSDSAAYNNKVISYCQKTRKRFVIAATKDAAVVKTIEAVPDKDWRELPGDLGVGLYAETVHAFNNEKIGAFRLIVIRRPYQRSIFDDNGSEIIEEYERCFAYATNLEHGPLDIIRTYNERGQAENLIKELKIGYGMEYTPCGDFGANAVWFGLGVIAYNLGQAMKLLALGGEWIRRQVVTLRWKIYNTAGKLISHAGRLILKVACDVEKLALFERVRRKLFEEYAAA